MRPFSIKHAGESLASTYIYMNTNSVANRVMCELRLHDFCNIILTSHINYT